MLLASGCTTQRAAFAGHDADTVWTAMVAAARTPDYEGGAADQRWTVRENEVWVDDENGRIEVLRKVERLIHQPATSPRMESRQWKLQIALEERDPPTVRFSSRNFGVPAHAWDEAARYFEDVRRVLEGDVGTAAAEETAEE